MRFHKTIFIVVGLLIIFSCSKEKDTQSPVITIDLPTHLQLINSGDTIQVKGVITDNKNIKSIRVVLRDDNNIPALSAINLQVNSTRYELNELYFFNDIHMNTGTYTFTISASDGENITTKYIDVSVGEVPKVRERVFIFDNVANTTSVYQLDNALNTSLFKTINGDFIGGIANSYYQQIISVGSATGNATAIDAEFATNLWEVSTITTPPTPYFTTAFSDNKTPYLGYYDGEIKGFDAGGNVNFAAHAVNGFYCESGFVHENYLVTEQVNITRTNFRFGLYYLFSGASYLQFLIFEDIIGMYSFKPNEIVLISNDASGNAKLSFFNISANGFSSPFSIGSGKIDATEEVGKGLYLISKNGDIRLINANTFTSQTYLSAVNANKIKYDVYTDELYLIDGNVLTVYDFSSKTLKGSYTHTNPILDVAFMYNR